MIFGTGFLKPTAEQLLHARKNADESFCAVSSEGFIDAGFPTIDGWSRAEATATLLRLKNVEPHDDPWVSMGAEPKSRRAIFWLLEGGRSYSGEGVFFGCGRDVLRLKPGEFVIFSDKVKHWVMSDRVWRGAAVQLRKADKV